MAVMMKWKEETNVEEDSRQTKQIFETVKLEDPTNDEITQTIRDFDDAGWDVTLSVTLKRPKDAGKD